MELDPIKEEFDKKQAAHQIIYKQLEPINIDLVESQNNQQATKELLMDVLENWIEVRRFSHWDHQSNLGIYNVM